MLTLTERNSKFETEVATSSDVNPLERGQLYSEPKVTARSCPLQTCTTATRGQRYTPKMGLWMEKILHRLSDKSTSFTVRVSTGALQSRSNGASLVLPH